VREASPCHSGSRAHVGKSSDAEQPADGAQYRTESNATSCAAMLRDCQAHSRARMGATSPGEPRPIAPYPTISIRYKERLHLPIYL
jgi:hypothetical protein